MTTQNFIDWKVSTRVAREFERIITGSTTVVTMASGRERRNAAWAYKKMQFKATYNMLSADSQLEVASAFYAANAQLMLFRFRDYGDYVVTNSPFDTSAVIGTKTPAQLTKRYTFGPAYADRIIQAIGGTCTVYDSTGAAVAGAVDTSLGLFTPSDNWGSGQYTWSGTFDCWVRFQSDELDVTMQMLDIATTDVNLIEGIAYAA